MQSPDTGAAVSRIRMDREMERILIVASERSQVSRLQNELENSGYLLFPAMGAREALDFLSHEAAHLVIVIAVPGAGPPERELKKEFSSDAAPEVGKQAPEDEPDGYELCQAIKPAAEANQIPVLLVASVWEQRALGRGLEAGADYFLFVPYQEQDLLRSIRSALLNGPAPEPTQVLPGVEVIHQDRMYTVTAGRGRLARLILSVYEELQQSRSAMSWSQAEVGELRQQLQQERQQTQLALLLPEVVQGIAHDFSNLLETVGAAASVLRSGPAQPAPYRAAMDSALSQAGALLAALQDWSQWDAEGWKTEPVELADVVQEAIEAALLPLCAPNIRVRVQVPGLPPIWSHRSLLFRCLSNLVWNAAQAMPSGGMLSILGYVQKNRVVLEVSDTGVGIAEEDQEKIFRPHFSTKNGHIGMGLSLVRSLVRRSGGEISFASRPGRGSTFALSFLVAEMERALSPSLRKSQRGTAARQIGAPGR